MDSFGSENVLMATEKPRLLNVRRGLCASVIGAIAGACVVVALPVVLRVTGLKIPGATREELGYDLREEPNHLIGPIIGCSTFCACAAWATFAPAGNYRFAWSLAIVFLGSVCLWLVLWLLNLGPQYHRGITDREWYPRLAVFVVIPSLVVTVCLTLIRLRVLRQRKG